MDGDFKGDFTRDSLDPHRLRQFSRVLMQQGRVQLDADWNEQTDLLLHALRGFIKDLAGPHWGIFDFDVDPPRGTSKGRITPKSISPNSFKIDDSTVQSRDFSIGGGHYYVDGILAENGKEGTTYRRQEPKQPVPTDAGPYLVYLDVWERQVTFLEDQDIREVALSENGPDTATRAEVVWQVKLLKHQDVSDKDIINKNAFAKIKFVEDSAADLQVQLQPENRGFLKARGKAPSEGDSNPCIISPDAQFRRNENQLYRVEIHTGGTATGGTTKEGATFKWSRENGSVVFPIVQVTEHAGSNIVTVTIENLGRDNSLSLEENDWVEIIDDDYILRVAALQGASTPLPLDSSLNPLLQVVEIGKTNSTSVQVTLKNIQGGPLVSVGQNHPLLRRWDQKEGTGNKGGQPKLEAKGSGTINIVEGKTEDTWLTLEDGVQIQFQPNALGTPL